MSLPVIRISDPTHGVRGVRTSRRSAPPIFEDGANGELARPVATAHQRARRHVPEAERFAGPISICESHEQFARSCDQVLMTNYANRRRDISRFVENESWISKVEMIADLISSWTAQPLKEATIPARAVLPTTAATTQEITAPN